MRFEILEGAEEALDAVHDDGDKQDLGQNEGAEESVELGMGFVLVLRDAPNHVGEGGEFFDDRQDGAIVHGHFGDEAVFTVAFHNMFEL